MPDSGTTAVPDLVGLPQSAAEAKLKSVGLVVGTVTTASSSNVPKGNVSSADPAAGTPVSPGSPVNLEVSGGPAGAPAGGPPQVAVPNVIGRTRGAAEAMLKSAGLVVGAVKTQHSHEVPADGISSTNPAPGTSVSSGSSVDLELSSGPEPDWTQYIQPTLLGLLGLLILAGIIYAVIEPSGVILGRLREKDAARGLITFLIAVATVGIAIILAISTLVLSEGDAGDKRFDRGKQVLSVMIGVLGTIVGFYFGSETTSPKQGTPTEQIQTSPPKITTTTLPDGAVNKPFPSTTLQTTGLTPPLKWSVTPALPAGLTLDATTGTISGTPTAAIQKTPFKFTVTDSSAPAVSSTVDLKLEIK
jgi:PASTA domain/Putative Ig domain